MKQITIILVVLVTSCSKPAQVEPRFCYVCHETNAAVKGNAATIGDAFTTFCSKTPSEISALEDASFERMLSDSTILTHRVQCIKSEQQ